jgi:HD-GYP domain-containing protein (c-di-GMP phosphodiesterase class II)
MHTSLILGARAVSLWMEDEGGDLTPQAWAKFTPRDRERSREQRIPRAAAEQLIVGDEPFTLTPEQRDELGFDADGHYLVAPLVLDNGTLGAICAALPDDDEHERRLALLRGAAHQARLALANANSFENLEGTFISTVEALANALEANDEYTSSHARSITDMALKVGRSLNLASNELKRLELGALFHDIGKIGIPSEILAKPGKLTDEERAVIETHPELGEKIIAPIGRLQEVCAIVRHCHERWDGAGYPDRLTEDSIPLESRIVFVCDAFHAMTTDRPYRKRLPIEEAKRRLQEGAGTQFDPDVVTVFVQLLDEYGDALG